MSRVRAGGARGRESRPLSALRVVTPHIEGPEDVIADADGSVLAGAADGTIWRLHLPEPAADGTARPAGATVPDARAEAVAHTGGRPLGLEPLAGGDLLVCDASRGLLRVTPGDGTVRVLADEVAGAPLRFCSNAVMAADGTVYFTVSSVRHALAEWPADILEHIGSGQLVRLRPGGVPEVLLAGLQFANGVALAPDDAFLVVAETGARRLARYWLTGPRAGRADTFAADLPGYPDNISRDAAGTFWIALVGPRKAGVELLYKAPLAVRRAAWKALLRLRRLPPPHPTVRVLAIRPDGGPSHDLCAANSPYRGVTSVCRTKGLLVMGSVTERGVAVCPLPGDQGAAER
ncbi:SMP-30/gluconolactonase/LRE family protein [Streptomyces sp. NPDC048506]|uniref:SMP-30/gluconolactonase/LRE family protein n=1 Tax=Streptomyces sp. NPDC048506 TaxID=3155028 RepID=UPI003429E63D